MCADLCTSMSDRLTDSFNRITLNITEQYRTKTHQTF